MSNLNLKGIWIPIEILTDENLDTMNEEIRIIQMIILIKKVIFELFNKTTKIKGT